MSEFEHLRHKPPVALARPRELVIACAPMKSNVNLSRIVRVAGCCGIERMIVCGNAQIDKNIARDGADTVNVEVRRTLPPVLKDLKSADYYLVGLEQTTNSASLHEYRFVRRTALVIGNERTGLTEDLLAMVDATIEIPVWGLPYSYNAATAATMALYEYCKQFPHG